jgi:hypothetical protein
MNQKPVIVTTEHRGVFFGYIENDAKLPTEITLNGVRNCVYWSGQTKGVLGLAAQGPNKECRIGPKVPSATLWKVTGVFDCTPVATEAWESEPWK